MSVQMTEVMEFIQRYVPAHFTPKVGIILGSGLSSLAEEMTQTVSVPYQAIPGLPAGGVSGHASLLVMGYLSGVPVVCLRGRLHLYEGIAYESICVLVRILRHLGCQMMLVTGAAGSLQANAQPGDIMMITDHINAQPGNPLVGPNDESVGPRFVAMDEAYDLGLQDIITKVAAKQSLSLSKGVYLATLGPSFETPAEIRAFRNWGADAVGMSVVPEVIVARHCGMRVAGLAAITNLAAGMSFEKITHDGTLHFGEIAARKLVKLIPDVIREMNNAII